MQRLDDIRFGRFFAIVGFGRSGCRSIVERLDVLTRREREPAVVFVNGSGGCTDVLGACLYTRYDLLHF